MPECYRAAAEISDDDDLVNVIGELLVRVLSEDGSAGLNFAVACRRWIRLQLLSLNSEIEVVGALVQESQVPV